MIKIEEDKLMALLEKKKTLIGKQKSLIIPPIVSAISLLVTFLCNKDSYPNQIVKLLMIFAVLLSSVYAIYVVAYFFLNNYNYNSLYYDIESLDDSKVHVFNIVVQKNNDRNGKFLLFYNESWKCNLFPNYKSVSTYKKGSTPTLEDIENVCKLYTSDTGIKISSNSLLYKGWIDDFKYSHNDKINKHYVFNFFLIKTKPADNLPDDKFEYGGKQYCWMTIPEMLKDRNIVKKNKKVVDYVKSFTTAS